MAAPRYHCPSNEIFIDDARCVTLFIDDARCLTLFFTTNHDFDASEYYLSF